MIEEGRRLQFVEEGRGGVRWGEALRGRLEHQRGRPHGNVVIRSLAGLFGHRIRKISGLEHIGIDRDPFVLALNHSQYSEALFVPATLGIFRCGKMIRFIADWNLQLVPGIWLVYRVGQVIILDRKPAKPAWLNIFRPLLTVKTPASERAAQLLDEGHSIGIFPEGTTNRDPRNLLRGFYGAAQLSMTKGVPVVPGGIRFPGHQGAGPLAETEPMEIEFGPAMKPHVVAEKPKRKDLLAFHGAIMQEIARLSGKSWQADSSRRKSCLEQNIST
jgi:1-acyl-sn-glycerol-3-phosphate acyltransferase